MASKRTRVRERPVSALVCTATAKRLAPTCSTPDQPRPSALPSPVQIGRSVLLLSPLLTKRTPLLKIEPWFGENHRFDPSKSRPSAKSSPTLGIAAAFAPVNGS
ncbi:MAG: hypothetical protein EXQ94_01970 [Alphaproteobacteria bacterium]|nr:hypothetical protein [Alphaproteobacteria bacterium]